MRMRVRVSATCVRWARGCLRWDVEQGRRMFESVEKAKRREAQRGGKGPKRGTTSRPESKSSLTPVE